MGVRERLKNRLIFIMSIYLLIFLVISAQLFNLQIVKGREYSEKAQRRILKNSTISAPRGNIFDRNNIPLAVNRMSYSVEISRTSVNATQLNEIVFKIIKILEKNNDYFSNSLRDALKYDPAVPDFPFSMDKSVIQKIWSRDLAVSTKDLKNINAPKDAFNYLKKIKFKIADHYSLDEAYKIMVIRYELAIRGYSAVSAVTVARDVSSESVAEIEERHFELKGVSTEVIPVRKYADSIESSHVIGYIGSVNAEELEKLKAIGYGMKDFVGKDGIELKMEKYLRGIDGMKQLEVDTEGRLTSEIGGRPAIPGKDVVLTIDSRLQKVAYNSLEVNINEIRKMADNKTNFGDAAAGAAIAMDVQTGEILAMTSYPSYDISAFLSGADKKEDQKKISEYLVSLQKPMINRAIAGTYIPGSIFKPITAIAALEENAIRPEQTIFDNGYYTLDGHTFVCLEMRMGLGAHGAIALKRALATSCNIYFHQVGVKTGIDNISKWCKQFGLGTRTGIDLPGEDSGVLGDKEFKRKTFKQSWYAADTAQTAIGQLYSAFTPIQIVNYMSSLANGGKRLKPHLLKKISNSDGTTELEVAPSFEQIPVKAENLSAVRDGMVAVTNSSDGTAVNTFRDFPFQVAGKTGTPETGYEAGKRSSNALFICYAPADAPKIAIAVVIERGAWGAYAAPVARDILKEYFGMKNIVLQEQVVEQDVLRLTK